MVNLAVFWLALLLAVALILWLNINIYLDSTTLWMRFGKRQRGFSILWNSIPMFSERNGYTRVWRCGKLSFRLLKACE